MPRMQNPNWPCSLPFIVFWTSGLPEGLPEGSSGRTSGLPEGSSGSISGLPEGSSGGTSGSSGRVFRKHFRVFRKGLPGLPEEFSGVFQQSSEVFRKSLPGLPEVSSGGRLRRSPIFLPLESRAKTWCSRQINPFQI